MTEPLECLAGIDWPAGLTSHAALEEWTLHAPFIIARGRQDEITVATVELKAGGKTGRGESCPVEHYGETPQSVLGQITEMLSRLEAGERWVDIHDELPAGAARNAVDCAVWDLAAKLSGKSVTELVGMPELEPVFTVYTLSVGTPDSMAKAAIAANAHSRLKVKLGGDGQDAARIRAIRAAVPDMPLIVDVNEYWSREMLLENLPVMAECGIQMLEQPLKAGDDAELEGIDHLVPIGADESVHVTSDLTRISSWYDVVNIKLDKTGGLTEALRLKNAAISDGKLTMVGCMLGTSLAMAPAHVIAQGCAFVDIDAPLLVGKDREFGMVYEASRVSPPVPELWGEFSNQLPMRCSF